MQPFLFSLVGLTAIAAYLAVHHGWLGRKRPDLGVHRTFSALAAASTVYGAIHVIDLLYPSVETRSLTEPLIFIIEGFAAWLMIGFVGAFTGHPKRTFRLWVGIALASLLLPLFLMPDGFRTGPMTDLRHVQLPWGESVVWSQASWGPAYFAFISLCSISLLWSLHASWTAWRRTGGGRQLALLLSLLVIVATVANNILNDLHLIATAPLIQHGFILLALIMSHVLSDEVARGAELERRLRQAEQFESVGRMASGVAHDFGNILTGIIGHAELLAMGLNDRPDLLQSAQAISRAGAHGTALTRQLRACSRGAPSDRVDETAVDVRAMARDVGGLIDAVSGRTVQVRLSLGDGTALVQADYVRLHSAMLNLAVNARDAMPTGGVLTIAVSERGPSPGTSLRRQPVSGKLVEIAISDTGTGIDPASLPHIFDWQFTTKGSRGSGLGLAQVDDLVRDAEGGLAVETEVGQGTTVRLWLPIAGAGSSSTERPPQGMRVLLVVGGSTVDQVLAAGLGKLGCHVSHPGQESPSGLQAVIVDADHAGKAGIERLYELPGNPPLVVLASQPRAWTDTPDSSIVLAKPAGLTEIGRALHQVNALR